MEINRLGANLEIGIGYIPKLALASLTVGPSGLSLGNTQGKLISQA